METLSYGFKKPSAGDSGGVFFPALELNIQKLNDHTHDGLNTSKIQSTSISLVSAELLKTGWVAYNNGWRMEVDMPVGKLYNNSFILFRDKNGHQLFLDVEKISDAKYYVYCNDNTLDLTALYVS